MYKIYKKTGKDLYNFTDNCGEITLRSSASEISEELSFEIKGRFLNEGDKLVLYKDKIKIFEGIIITVDIQEYTSSISCADFGWYLNKNEDMYQFNDSITGCIKRILNDHAIPIGFLENITIAYKKVNRGNLSDLIKKLLEYAQKSTGKIYIWEMRQGKFYLELQSNKVITYTTNLFENTIDVTKLSSNQTYKKSIDKLYNAVKVVNQEENEVGTLAYREDRNSINKYGKIQKLETVTKEEKGNATNIAVNQLKLLNKIDYNVNVELPGIIECRANKVLQFKDDKIIANGNYRILQCTHNINANKHLMDLELEVI